MKVMVDKNKNNFETKQALLTVVLACLLFFLLGLENLPAQECDGTQFRTDNRGLVYVPKGQKEKLLIGGVWYDCEGCGACVPVSNEGAQPQVAIRRPRPRRQQELTDEEMIKLIERTKALTAQVKAEDEDRLKKESFLFLDRLSLLAPRSFKVLRPDLAPSLKA